MHLTQQSVGAHWYKAKKEGQLNIVLVPYCFMKDFLGLAFSMAEPLECRGLTAHVIYHSDFNKTLAYTSLLQIWARCEEI